MEHDHRVVERIAQDRQDGRNGIRRDLAPKQGVDAEHEDQVVQQRHDGGDAHLVVAEAQRDVDDDEHERDQEGEHRGLDDRRAPVGTDGRDLEAVGRPAERAGDLVGDGRGILGRRGGGTHEEAFGAVGGCRLDDGIALARIGERIAQLFGGHVARVMERNRGAAHEFDAEFDAADADEAHDRHDGDGRKRERDLAVLEDREVALDEAAGNLVPLGRNGGPFEIRSRVLAVLHAPEARMARDEARREQADDRRLEQQHHDDVAEDAERERQPEALDRRGSQEEQRERGHERDEVGVDRGQNAVTHAGHGCGAHASAHADLFAEPLQRKDRRVGGHADGEHDARDAGQRQREQAEARKPRENTQVKRCEHEHGGSGDEAEPAIEHKEVQHDEQQADGGDEHAGMQGVLTEGRADGLRLLEFEIDGQRAGLEHGLQRLRLVERVVAGDGHPAVGNRRLDGRRALHHAVEDDDDLALGRREVGGRLGEGLAAFAVQSEVDRIVRRRFACAVDRDALDVVARDDGRVGARLDGHARKLAFAGRQRGAVRVGRGLLRHVFAGIDLLGHIGVGEGVEARELELAGLADRVERLLGVGDARDLHEDLVIALKLDDRLGRAEGVHAAFDDGTRLLHIVRRDIGTIGAVRAQDDRQAALDVEALVDAVLGRHE